MDLDFSRRNMEVIGLVAATAFMQSTFYSVSTAQTAKTYLNYDISATWFEDAESPWTVAPGENRWSSFKEGAENLGLLFAGRAEFPWVVDIRVDKATQDVWATGNLVTDVSVFTTCRAVDNLRNLEPGERPRIQFAQMYMLEYTELESDKRLAGSRNIAQIRKHPKCNFQQLYYDGGLITLAKQIRLRPPTLSTIQLSFNYGSGKLRDFDFRRMNEYRIICYIASIGRDYYNIQNHLTKDFKVKYRVYWEEPSLCIKYVHSLCPWHQVGQEACDSKLWETPDGEGREWMCFKTRAKVGAVCDHDRGAPLVCDGEVFGLVVMGAIPERCNDLLAMPFWVQKVSIFKEFFDPPKEGGSGRSLGFKTRQSSANSLLNHDNYQRLLPILIPFICSHLI